jgi:hypothetical protein
MAVAGGMIPTGEYGTTLNNPMYDSGRQKTVSVHQTFGQDLAAEVGKDLVVPEGWGCVVIGFGDDPSQMGPVTVTHNDWVLRFPRNSRRAIPAGHFDILMNCVERRYIQSSEGAALTGYDANRYNVQVLKWPEGSSIDREHVEADMEEVNVA